MTRRYLEIDVFGAESVRLSGNPVGVILDSAGLDTADMQRFARWTNFSETTFLMPAEHPDADYKVRIFTPTMELPFAGHPTLGSCFAWLSQGFRPKSSNIRVIQECGIGLVPILIQGEAQLSFSAPKLIRFGPVAPCVLDEIINILNIPSELVVDAHWIDNGPGWIGVLLPSAADVLALRPQSQSKLNLGVFGPYEPGCQFAYEVRAFFSEGGTLVEDPVCGSLNASGAQWLVSSNRFRPPYMVSQGLAIGRNGQISVTKDENEHLWVGGRVVTVATAEVEL